MRLRSAAMLAAFAVLLVGIVLHGFDVPHAGWPIAIAAAALVFLFLMPAMGERARQPPDAPERRVHFGD